jgi:hypothetical protein
MPIARWPELGGERNPHDPGNLAAACVPCNRRKRDHLTGIDPVTGLEHPLFNPRQQLWREHFAFSEDYAEIIGVTPVGRATVSRLEMNRLPYRRQRRLLRLDALQGGEPWP